MTGRGGAAAGRLQGKVALVTGAARGVGVAIARAFGTEGAQVVVGDLDGAAAAAAAAALGARASWQRLDVREELAWIRVMAAVLDRHGRLDVLVNHAGSAGLEAGHALHDPEHASLADWQAVHRSLVDGVFLGCKHGLRAMRRGGGGSIVNVSSCAGSAEDPDAAAWAAGVAAVRSHTRAVARHAAAQRLGVRCNAIVPPLAGAAAASQAPVAAAAAAMAVLLASDAACQLSGGEFHLAGG